MSNTKKFLMIFFVVAMVINLQFNTPLTHNMENGFSVKQLSENIFLNEIYAYGVGGGGGSCGAGCVGDGKAVAIKTCTFNNAGNVISYSCEVSIYGINNTLSCCCCDIQRAASGGVGGGSTN